MSIFPAGSNNRKSILFPDEWITKREDDSPNTLEYFLAAGMQADRSLLHLQILR
jgi:uncharacterized protein YfiM (DUF2279 family)